MSRIPASRSLSVVMPERLRPAVPAGRMQLEAQGQPVTTDRASLLNRVRGHQSEHPIAFREISGRIA